MLTDISIIAGALAGLGRCIINGVLLIGTIAVIGGTLWLLH